MMRTTRLTDDAIRAALTPPQNVQAPIALEDAIWSSISTTPQRRPGLWGVGSSPRTRLVAQLVVVALLLIGLVIGALVIGSKPAILPSVTTYHGGPERTGVMPGPGPAANPVVAWQESARGGFGPWSPAVVDGGVYVGDQSGWVTAFDEATGAQRWQVSVGAAINSAVAVADGVVLVGDDAGILHARAVSTGAQEWSYPTKAPIHGSVAVADGVVYFGNLDGQLFALDLATQKPRWPPVQAPGQISRAVAAAGGIIYAGAGGADAAAPGTLRAYSESDGSLLWPADLDPGNTSTPTVAGGLVFVASGLDGASGAHHIFAFDATTGEPAWPGPFATASNRVLLLGAVADGRVYVTGTDGLLYVLDAATGGEDWEATIGSSQSPNAAIVGETLYVTSDDRKVHAFDLASHAEEWAVPVTGTPGAPAVVDGAIFVTTSSGKVVRIGGSGSGTR